MAHAVVAGVDRGAGRDSFRPGMVDLSGSRAVQGAVRAHGVVVAAERVQERLELVDGDRAGLAIQPFLEGLMEALHLSAGLQVAGQLKRDPVHHCGVRR